MRSLVKVLPIYLAMNVLLSLVYLTKLDVENFLMIYKAIFWNVVNVGKTFRRREGVNAKMGKVGEDSIFEKVKKNPGLGYFYYLAKNDLKSYEDTNY